MIYLAVFMRKLLHKLFCIFSFLYSSQIFASFCEQIGVQNIRCEELFNKNKLTLANLQ